MKNINWKEISKEDFYLMSAKDGGLTPTEIAEGTAYFEQEEANLLNRHYLKETDWMVVREAETGTAMPADVKEKRAAARAAVL